MAAHSHSSQPSQPHPSWMSYDDHSCIKLYKEIMNFKLPERPKNITQPTLWVKIPEYIIAALYRIIHCKKCEKQGMDGVVGQISYLASYYILFGGNLKIKISKKPKMLLKDTKIIKSMLGQGIKMEPNFLPGKVKNESENISLYEKLGSMAIIAGMINPRFINSEHPLIDEMIDHLAIDELPITPEIDRKIMFRFGQCSKEAMRDDHHLVFMRYLIRANSMRSEGKLHYEPPPPDLPLGEAVKFDIEKFFAVRALYMLSPDNKNLILNETKFDDNDSRFITDLFISPEKYESFITESCKKQLSETDRVLLELIPHPQIEVGPYLIGTMIMIPIESSSQFNIVHYTTDFHSFLSEDYPSFANLEESRRKIQKKISDMIGSQHATEKLTALQIRAILIEKVKKLYPFLVEEYKDFNINFQGCEFQNRLIETKYLNSKI